MSTSSKLAENIFEPLLVGGIAAAFVKFFYPETSSFKILGTLSLPEYALVGITVGASSAVSETLKFWVLPYIPHNKSLAGLESMFLGPVITGVTSMIAFPILTDSKPKSYVNGFLLGAGSDLTGKYIYSFAKSAKHAL
jgi:hypothetical protein